MSWHLIEGSNLIFNQGHFCLLADILVKSNSHMTLLVVLISVSCANVNEMHLPAPVYDSVHEMHTTLLTVLVLTPKRLSEVSRQRRTD